ncbi:MAG: IS66 family transposase [Verrucomicrobiales bacterium]|nr:IS66 family transposase [Verrucomicrobiales bacterium]
MRPQGNRKAEPTSLHRLNYCPQCLQKQQEIDRLREENARLKGRLRYQERSAREGPFGSSTPSAKVPIKPSAAPDQPPRRGGARPGHRGHGRGTVSAAQADRVQRIPVGPHCPQCGGPLQDKGVAARSVLDVEPLRRQTLHYQLEQKYCPHCRQAVSARAPGVLPRHLLGNRLLAHVAVQHYVHGVTLGQLESQLHVGYGTLMGALHQLARRLEPVIERLVREYRQAPVKHADETGWRTDGRNGYAWLFCTDTISLFRFRQTRSAQVAHQVLGTRRLGGVLVVDRYHGYNRSPCALQYCYAHLLRDVGDLEKEFPDQPEIQRFVAALAPLLARAMHLRGLQLTPAQFRKQAAQTRAEIQAVTKAPAQHPAIQKIQNIFREKGHRLYHWAKHRDIPADNNRAERELRPLVIARKVSFGSQSEAGARTREVLMSVLHTMRKRTGDVTATFQDALDRLIQEPQLDLYPLLFRCDSS